MKDGVAVYLTQGSARTTVAPNLVDVSILTQPSTSFSTVSEPTISAAIATIFREAGLSVRGMSTEPDNPQWYKTLATGTGAMRMPRPEIYPPNSWRMLYKVEVGIQQLSVLNETLEHVRSQFRDQIGRTYECAGVVVDGPESEATWSRAEDDASRRAEELAQITRGGAIGWGRRVGSWFSQSSSSPDAFCDIGDAVVYVTLPTFVPFTADTQVEMRYQGSQSPSNGISPGVAALARAAFAAPHPLSTYVPVLSIAADRPELYVLGGALANASVKAGLLPNAVAILAARAQAQTVATILGLKLGTESLYATDVPLSGDSTVGVATTFSRNGVALSFPRSDAAGSLQLHGVQNSNSIDEEFSPKVPIDVAQPGTALRERTYAQAYAPYHMLRFQMELNSDNGSSSIATTPIIAKLRSVRGVIDAAASSANGGAGALYNVIVQRTARSTIPQIANIIAAPYGSAKAEVRFGLNPFIGDCAPAAREMLRLTLQESWHAAQAAASAKHVRLRKLLLVAVSPEDNGALCYPLAKDAGGREYESVDEIPLVPTPVMESGVRLVFRTSQ
ncbi:MAG: hypothetical protein JOZ77_10570 [Candidatus Eremiobacteraeota bacterium]|nr:hypothetical protein [Candidatus Eremiobacteraeota bacterium]